MCVLRKSIRQDSRSSAVALCVTVCMCLNITGDTDTNVDVFNYVLMQTIQDDTRVGSTQQIYAAAMFVDTEGVRCEWRSRGYEPAAGAQCCMVKQCHAILGLAQFERPCCSGSLLLVQARWVPGFANCFDGTGPSSQCDICSTG